MNGRMTAAVWLLSASWGLATVRTACAQPAVPAAINFQGRLTDTLNNPLSGTHSLGLQIFDAATGGNLLWGETQPSVPVVNGVFAVQLGAVAPLAASVFSGATSYLQVTVDGSVMSPRTRLLASPYAFNAQALQGRDFSAFVSTDAATQNIAGAKTFTGSVTVPSPVAPGQAATKAYVDAATGTSLLTSTNTWSGGNLFLGAFEVTGPLGADVRFDASGPVMTVKSGGSALFKLKP